MEEKIIKTSCLHQAKCSDENTEQRGNNRRWVARQDYFGWNTFYVLWLAGNLPKLEEPRKASWRKIHSL